MPHLSNKIKALLVGTLLTVLVYANKGSLEEYLGVIGIVVPIAMAPDSDNKNNRTRTSATRLQMEYQLKAHLNTSEGKSLESKVKE